MPTGRGPGIVGLARRASEGVERASMLVAGAFLVLNVTLILLAVVTRYVLKSSFMWTEELARYCLIYAVMIGANAALRNGDHMAIEFIYKRLPAPVSAVANWVKRAVVLFIFGLMAYRGFIFASKAWATTTLGLGIPRAVPLMAVPVGMALLLVQYVLIQIAPPQGREG